MEQAPISTSMIHYQCQVCGMTATCVVTAVTSLAWLDHMDSHADSSLFLSWTWQALQLEL
jgi:hypothetical protein